MSSIIDLPSIVSALSKDDQELFSRFFIAKQVVGKLKFPEEMKEWANKNFGSYKDVETQKIIKVFNKQTYAVALFNEIRAKRPITCQSDEDSAKIIRESVGDPFCKPSTMTPEDELGRVKGKHCVSASNVAKYDALHGLIIFKQHNPLLFTEKEIIDYLKTAMKWFKKANKKNKEAVYPFLLWNCLWKAGASIIHGHMQLALGEGFHYGEAEYYNKIRREYYNNFKSDYFEDLWKAHVSIGLGLKNKKIKIFASITPRKEKEITIITDKLDKEFMKTIAKICGCLVKDLGVNSFNLGIILPPLRKEDAWKDFPVIARIVDRGKLSSKTSDMAGMEIYAGSSVIETDPYKVFEKVKEHF